MKFLSIVVTDLLAYEKSVPLNLSATTSEKNIVLVWGRNGKGKTSLLTALKLLFAGIRSESSRTVGFPPRPLPESQFVLGDGDHWMGLINRRAVRRAANEGAPPTGSVEATWEQDGRQIFARREWMILPAGGYEERIQLNEGDVRLTGEAAADRLAEYLPPQYVGFFFFDGEDIKSLAETAERKAIDFDHLLRINFVKELADELEKAATERRRRTMSKSDKDALRKVEVALDDSRYVQRDAAEQLRDIEDRLVNEQAKLRRAEAIRDNLSSGATDAQRKELERQKERLETENRTAAKDIFKRVPEQIAVLSNLQLLEAAMGEMERRFAGSGAAEHKVVGRISKELPSWMASIEVAIDADARSTIISALRTRLDKLVSVDPSVSLFTSLGLDRSEQLLELLRRYVSAGRDVRGAHVALLTSLHRGTVQYEAVDDELTRLRVGSETNIERFREAERDIRSFQETIAELNQAKGVQTKRAEEAAAAEKRLEAELKDGQAKVNEASKDEVEARQIEQVVQALFDAREALRRTMRDEVQERVNVRFRELVHDHNLIDTIRIDDSYTMNFFDRQDRPIGRASLSSGIKQLAATALLWAMKDASKHDVPVVIDTPLGRIDRENQDRMLEHYYPKLASQVLILPTNAEIDERKKALIQNRIADEYTIENDSGDMATIVHIPLVER